MSAEVLRDECTPEETVELIRTVPPNPAQIRPAKVSLADLLQATPSDPTFDLETWRHQWSDVEAELRSLTRANEIAEGRRR
jgi:hypothetical protein